MTVIYPLTLLYDAACPVCALEMEHLRSRNTAGRLVIVNIAVPGFDAAAFGASAAELDAQIHAHCADGTVLRGMEALRLAYAAVGLGWVLWPTGLAPLRALADFAYGRFARHRRKISGFAVPLIEAIATHRARRGAQRLAACRDGACATPARAQVDRTQGETS